jgi:predicted nuclease of predicted toxin-antitoxin system
MRFLGDMGVSRRVIEWLRAAGHDAVHLRDEGLKRLSNGDIFQKGFAEQRIVMTFDLDFGEILAGSAGQVVSVVLFRLHDTRTNHVIERLQNVLDQSSRRVACRGHHHRRGRPPPRPQIAHRKPKVSCHGTRVQTGAARGTFLIALVNCTIQANAFSAD